MISRGKKAAKKIIPGVRKRLVDVGIKKSGQPILLYHRTIVNRGDRGAKKIPRRKARDLFLEKTGCLLQMLK
jgi:hypothetical protein